MDKYLSQWCACGQRHTNRERAHAYMLGYNAPDVASNPYPVKCDLHDKWNEGRANRFTVEWNSTAY